MKRYYIQFALSVLISNCAMAQNLPICDSSIETQMDHLSDRKIRFEANNINIVPGLESKSELIGNVIIRNDNSITKSNKATYDQSSESLSIEGDVSFKQDDLSVLSQNAEFSYSSETFSFQDAMFEMNNNNSRGEAELIEINENGSLNLKNVNYTTCPKDSIDWMIKANEITLDPKKGEATAKKLGLTFKGVPIFYLPKISFPIDSSRKTGFLAPEIGGGGRSGNELRLPFYFNIASNYDATIIPRILSGRGFQLGSEFRYLDKNNTSNFQIDYLSNDNIYGKSRHYVKINHETIFENGFRARIDFGDTSDGNYFEDLGRSLSLTSITHLNQSLLFDAYGDNWSIMGRFQNFQTIDESISQDQRPYYRLPQIKIKGSLPYKPFGISTSLDSEIVYFDREFGVTGWRVDNEPKIEWELKKSGWYLKPALSLKHTQYELKNLRDNQKSNPSRTLPISSIDAGLFFERSLKNYPDHIQTLEPRILYINKPFRDQANIPIFDTIEPDFNLIQLFQKNRFLGIDRIADSDQISLGFSSKITNMSTGNDLITATLGKAFYLKNQKVTLPNQNNNLNTSSDYIAEVRLSLISNLNFNFSHQWSDDQAGVARSQAKLQYRPSGRKLFNLGYRFRQDLLEQGNISWSWPLSESWNFLGHYNYSLRDNKSLEQFYGLEYESCCWGIRMVYRQYVSTRDGQEDNSFGIQFILKGMTSIGTNANKLLERGILGYSSEYIE